MSSAQTLEVPGFQVVQFLGSGARSTIWQVRDVQSNKLYALKRTVKRESNDDKFLLQALNEYDIGSQLDHQNIRHIYSMRKVKRWLNVREIHLVMELCEGKTVQEQRPESLLEILRIFHQVALAVTYMNEKGFAHADIKPNNIVVSSEGVIKIIDLGQSCRLGTIKERIQGTPDFIAPEQVNRHPIDARTDVFNFGAALYWTLTGKPIPTILPRNNNLPMLSDLAVKPPETLNPNIPAPLSKLLMDCIEPHPRQRPESLRHVGTRLDLISHMLRQAEASKAAAEAADNKTDAPGQDA